MTTKPPGASELTREWVEERIAYFKSKLVGADDFGADYHDFHLRQIALCQHYLSTAPAPAVAEPVAEFTMAGIITRVLCEAAQRFGGENPAVVYIGKELLSAPPERTAQPDENQRALAGENVADYSQQQIAEEMHVAAHSLQHITRRDVDLWAHRLTELAQPTGASEAVVWVLKGELQKASESAYMCRLIGKYVKRTADMVPLYTAQPNWRDK